MEVRITVLNTAGFKLRQPSVSAVDGNYDELEAEIKKEIEQCFLRPGYIIEISEVEFSS